MTKEIINFTTPVGRIISGSVHTANTTDQNGNPLVTKSGPNAGQPRQEYSIGLAVPKTAGVTDWKQEAWTAPLLQAAQRDFPQLFSAPGQLVNPQHPFAWKVTDGDSTVTNLNGNRPCDMTGAAGNWVLWLKDGFAPKLWKWSDEQNTAVALAPGEEIKRGYFVEVFGSVGGNNAQPGQQGLYLNLSMVCLRFYGDEITSGPSLSQAGFGGTASMPVGASTMPAGASTMAAVPAPAVPAPAVPAPAVPAPAVPAPAPAVPAPAPAVPAPATDLMNGPGNTPVPPAPPVPTAPAAPTGPLPTDNFMYQGTAMTRAQLHAASWTDEMITQHCTPA